MGNIELQADTRETLGKKVRFLRRKGVTPVHVFGHGIDSLALQCDSAALRHVLDQAGRTRLIAIKVGKARKARNTVVREVQKDPVTGELLHVDFYQVRMEEKIKVDVPITMVGEAPVLKIKGTMLEQELDTLSIECLPDKIPGSVEVDLTSLVEPDQAIHVKDLVLGDGISVLDDPDQLVVKIGALHVEKEEEVAEAVGEAAGEAVTAHEEPASGE